MIGNDLTELNRAHQLFGGTAGAVAVAPLAVDEERLGLLAGVGFGGAHRRYQEEAGAASNELRWAARADDAMTSVIRAAREDHWNARQATGRVLDEARGDTAIPEHPMAQREAVRRHIARLNAQRAHVSSARARARHHAAVLRSLRYRNSRRHRLSLSALTSPRSRAAAAVRAALSRLGRPYVWGATGPDQFDCSGLVQWSYAQAGLHLDRTTYQQILEGIPVSRADVRPGDLVFPHAGHVQMALGHGLVVEAPYSGATVRISRLGSPLVIRRPVF